MNCDGKGDLCLSSQLRHFIALGAGIAGFLLVRFLRRSGVKDGGGLVLTLGPGASDPVLTVPVDYEKQIEPLKFD